MWYTHHWTLLCCTDCPGVRSPFVCSYARDYWNYERLKSRNVKQRTLLPVSSYSTNISSLKFGIIVWLSFKRASLLLSLYTPYLFFYFFFRVHFIQVTKYFRNFLLCFQIHIYCNTFSHFILYATLNPVFTKNRAIYLVFLPSKINNFLWIFFFFPLVYYAGCAIVQFNDSLNLILLCFIFTAYFFALGVVGDSFNLGSKCLMAEFWYSREYHEPFFKHVCTIHILYTLCW